MGRAGRRDSRNAGRVADLRPRRGDAGVVVPAAGRRQRHLQDLGRRGNKPEAFKLLIEIDNVVGTQGHGLRTRAVTIGATTVRYLKVGEPIGDRFYSISEFQAYCRPPTPFPPKLTVSNAPPAIVVQPWFWKFAWWENDASSRVEMALALAALALLGWGIWLTKQGRRDFKRKLRDRLLMVVGLLSFCAYWNFGSFHFGNYFHVWDTFHYYVGSKYFKELSYDRLYECVAVADSEEPALRRRVELRKIMNLRTNMMVGRRTSSRIPSTASRTSRPSAGPAFKHDVAYFRNHHDVKRWEEAQTDHGYNATPVWNIVGTTLANLAPASDDQISFLTRIDPFFIFGIILMTWWAFGWRTMCVALAVFATNFPSRFYWTGGAFLRWDWLFYFVGGVCLVKKERSSWAAFFLGYSTLLRVFPMFIFSGPILGHLPAALGEGRRVAQAGARASGRRRRRRARGAGAEWRTAAATVVAAGAVGLLAGAGGARRPPLRPRPRRRRAGGGDPGAGEPGDQQRHRRLPRVRLQHQEAQGDAAHQLHGPAHGRRLQPVGGGAEHEGRSPGGSLGSLEAPEAEDLPRARADLLLPLRLLPRPALPGAQGRRAVGRLRPRGMTMAVGVELTCYYYSFLFAITLLYHKRREAGAILLGATAVTGFIDWSPTRYLPDVKPWMNFKVSQWLDEQYTMMSFATLAAFCWILYRFAYVRPIEESAVAEAAVAVAGATGAEAAHSVNVRKPARRGGGNETRRRGGRRSRRR